MKLKRGKKNDFSGIIETVITRKDFLRQLEIVRWGNGAAV